MDANDLARSLAAATHLRTEAFMRLAALVLRPSTATRWENAVKDARDAQALFTAAEDAFDAKMNEMFPE